MQPPQPGGAPTILQPALDAAESYAASPPRAHAPADAEADAAAAAVATRGVTRDTFAPSAPRHSWC